MAFCFNQDKVTNIILFILHCLGGTADIQRLYFILYLADIKHLSRYGSLMTGDTYLAMKTGPLPFNILAMYRKLKERPLTKNANGKTRLVLSISDKLQAVAHVPCDTGFLAESEVNCLFETVHQYKSVSNDVLLERVKSKAWHEADSSGELNLLSMAVEEGASSEMIRYIEMSFADEVNSFKE